LNYYSENLRESKESLLACVKNASFDRIEEFELYDEYIDHSFFKQICFFSKLDGFLKQPKHEPGLELNIDFFIDFMSKNLENQEKLTWNLDSKVLNPNFLKRDIMFYWGFLDLFNNFEIFKVNFYRAQLENCLRKPEKLEEMEKVLILYTELKEKVDFEKMHDFTRFNAKNPINPCGIDKFTSEILKKRLQFEMLNLGYEKSLFSVFLKIFRFKQEESLIEQIMKEMKEISIFNLFTLNFS
jgi:hypothetical protein